MQRQHPLVSKFERAFKLNPEERESVNAVPFRQFKHDANQDLVREGDHPTRCIMIMSGIASTSKIGSDGKRQITALHVPEDMPDLLSLHLEIMDSDIRTLSPCTIAVIEHGDIRWLSDRHPRLAALLWRATLVDASVFREWVFNIGQRQALSRIAHLFCEIVCRLDTVGLVHDLTCAFHINQTDLAATTGLSVVHINRNLQALRKRGLIRFGQGELQIRDWNALVALADFRPDYLHLGPWTPVSSS